MFRSAIAKKTLMAMLLVLTLVGLTYISPDQLDAVLVSSAGIVVVATATTISKDIKTNRKTKRRR